MYKKILIAGGGQAGSSLAVKLRALGFEGELTIIGDETAPPYQRPPLSKAYLLGEMEEARLWLRPREFYAEQNIRLVTGDAIGSVNREARHVTLKSGKHIEFDALALTTGARPRLLPGNAGGSLRGVYAVRTLADVDAMAPEFREGARALIIGGGYIGLEAAAVAALRGLKVTLIELGERILQRVACRETSDYFRALHQSHGVDIREGTALERLEGMGRAQRAILAGGEALDIDFAIVGIGVTPSAELAAGAGLAVENGISVDEFCRTSDKDIYAAGDCASFPHNGARIRLESVQNAIDQAEAAAAVMMGGAEPYRPKPWFWSDQYDVKLQIAGLNTGFDRVISRGEGAARSFWYLREGRLIAVDAMNDPRAYMTGKRMIEAGKTPPAEMLADGSAALKEIMAAAV